MFLMRFERTTFRLGGERSILLSYRNTSWNYFPRHFILAYLTFQFNKKVIHGKLFLGYFVTVHQMNH